MGIPIFASFLFAAIAIMLFTADILNHKKGVPVSFLSAILWSLLYVAAALVFASFLYISYGREASTLFLTGYTLEKMLAFDNLFVFSMIFAYFKIPYEDQHSALHWGILGAIVFRLIFVYFGVMSVGLFGAAMEFLFAIMIAGSIYLIVKGSDEEKDYNNSWYIKIIRKYYPSITIFPVAIIVIEISDIMFSFDSVPAIIAVTKEPFLIYSSMIFAILGLRSMYFVIASLSRFLVYMDQAIIMILSFISLKLIIHSLTGFQLDPLDSLFVILSIMTTAVVASLIKGKSVCQK